MLRRERLEFKNWWNLLGQRAATAKLLDRFEKESRPALQGQLNGLINQLVREQKRFDGRHFIQRVLPTATEKLKANQFSEGLELASRLSAAGINPAQMLQYGLPALAQNANSFDAFKTNLLYLEALVTHHRDHGLDIGKGFFVAIRTAARDLDTRQLTSSLVLATRIAEKGFDVTNTLRFALPAAAIALTDQQFRLALTLANHVVRRKRDVAQLLGHDLPDLAREVSPEELTIGLRVAIHLEEKHIATDKLFRKGLPAMVAASSDTDHYSRNLDLLATLLVKLQQQKMPIEPPLLAMTSECKKASDFHDNAEALYRFCQSMRKHKVIPSAVLQHGFPPTVPHTPESFQATLQYLTTVVVRFRDAKVNDCLVQYIIEFCLDPVAKTAASAEEFRKRLTSLVKSFRFLAVRDIEPPNHEKAFKTIKGSKSIYSEMIDQMTPGEQLQGGLAFLYELAINAHFDWRDIPHENVKAMTKQAIKLNDAEKKYTIDSTKSPPELVPTVEGHAAFRSRVRGVQSAKKK